jgi:hypothetical protein
MASQLDAGAVAVGQPGLIRLPAPDGTEETLWQTKPAGPVQVEARRVLTGNVAGWPALAEWCGGLAYTEETPWDYDAGAVIMPDGHRAFVSPRDWGVIVPTPQGYKVARYGWWIVKSAEGQFGTCDPGFFAATYEPAGADPETPLSDAEHAIGQVVRHAESWQMQGGQLDAAHAAGALLSICAPWTGGLRIPETGPASLGSVVMAAADRALAEAAAGTASDIARSALAGDPEAWRKITTVVLLAIGEHARIVPKDARPTDDECSRLRQMVTGHENALSAVKRALDLTAALDDADREIIAAGRAGLKVLEGSEDELEAVGTGPLLDPDCRDGKHGSCVGSPCECPVPGVHSTPHEREEAGHG